MSIQDLDQRFSIINPDGTPSDYLMRVLRDRGSAQTSTDTTLAVLQETIGNKADKSVIFTAGTGLSGGGDLSADRTFDLNAGIDLLTDVDTTSTPPTDGQALLWDNASSLWVPGTVSGGGSGGGTAIKARGYRNTAVNTGTTGWQSLVLDGEDYDPQSIFDPTTGRFTPTIAGYYLVNGRVRVGSNGINAAGIGLNGSITHALGGDTGSAVLAIGGSSFMYCNGTTDYLTLMYYTTAARAVTTGTLDTYMEVYGPLGV